MAIDSKSSIHLVSNLSNDELLETFVLDTMTTTERGVLKAVFESYFKENPFDGVTSFMGQVLRGTNDFESASTSDYYSMALEQTNVSSTPIRQKCKVRIFNLTDLYPVPCTFGEFDEDEYIINMYPDTIFERINGDNTELSPGDIVKISYENLKRFERPYVVYKYSSPDGESTKSPIGIPKRCSEGKKTAKAIFKRTNIELTKETSTVISNFNKYISQDVYTRYNKEIQSATIDFPNVARELILAVISQESGFDPNAKSAIGAKGLMQIKLENNPSLMNLKDEKGNTNKLRERLNKKFTELNNSTDSSKLMNLIFRPDINIWIGTAILSENISLYPGDTQKALAAYNGGRKLTSRSDWKSALKTWGNGETFTYVLRVSKFLDLIRASNIVV